MRRVILVVLGALILAAPVFATGSRESMDAGDSVYEYSVYFDTDELFEWWDNPNDVVTPYIEEKFGLVIGDQYWRSGQLTEERINTFVASNSFPDLFVAAYSYAPQLKDLAYDLTDLLPRHMPNYWNSLSRVDRDMHYIDGSIYFVFKRDEVDWTPEALADPYNNGYGLSLQIREDILVDLGYEFTPMAEIEAVCRREHRAATLEDFAFSHPEKELPLWQGVPFPYSTPEEFADFLQDIKDLGATDRSGNEVFPLTLRWGIQQIGAGAYDWSNGFRYNYETGEAEGYLGSSETYEFLRWWWGMYRDELLDPDYVIQTNTQLEEKVTSGRAAMWFEPNQDQVNAALTSLDPSWTVRPMPNPQGDPHSHWYPYTPGYFGVFLNRDMPEELVIRFLEMWDYMYSEEGMLDLVYGPEEAGFRTVRSSDGRVVFTEEMQELYDRREKGIGGPDEYGLVHSIGHRWGSAWSRIAYLSAAPRDFGEYGPARAFPPDPHPLARARRMFSAFGMALTNDFAYPVGEASKATSNYWNSTFKYQDIAELLNARTTAEFDAAFAVMQERNETIGRYSEAVEEMTDFFHTLGIR